MQALVFRYHLARLAFAKAAGLLTPGAYLSRWSPTTLRDIPDPGLIADDWTVVRTSLCS